MEPRRPVVGRDAVQAMAASFALLLAVGFAVGGRLPLWAHAVAIELALLAPVLLVGVLRRLDARDALSLRRPRVRALAVVLVGTAALHFLLRASTPAIEAALRWMGLDFPDDLRRYTESMKQAMEESPVALVIVVTTLPALCEEALFRGIALSGLRRSLGPVAALLLTSALFGLIHVLPVRIVITFALGLWFGAAVLATRSLWAGVLAHFVNNALALTGEESGGPLVFAGALVVLGVMAVLLWRLREGDYDGGRGA